MLQIMSAALSTDRSDRRRPVAARSWASNRMFRARRRAMLCHQTINAIVMTWQANAPPANLDAAARRVVAVASR